MPKVFLPITQIKGKKISITGEKARYLSSVLRCKGRDELTIFDGKGNCFRTEIIKVNRREVITEVQDKYTCDTESPLNITLVQGILKGQKMDIVIQKATELGVKEIIPIITERSQPRQTRKVARWQKIAEEASRQCGRSIIPFIHEPVEFEKFFVEENLKKSEEIVGLIFWEEDELSIKEAIDKISFKFSQSLDLPVYILIGPEGGFSKEEISFAEREGFIVCSLGKRILRAETAAFSAVVLVQFLLGDLG